MNSLRLDTWSAAASEICEDNEAYLFPAQLSDGFDFSTPISYAEHAKAVQRCASQLGLATCDQHLASFTSQSIRSGVAAGVVRLLKDTLAGANKFHGRAKRSKIDTEVYCPDHVFLEPGPLFANAEEINSTMAQFLANRFHPLKENLLCSICGFPACKCLSCAWRSNNAQLKTSCKIGHSCWLLLLSKGGRKCKSGPSETDQQADIRSAAWSAFGILEVPGYQDGKFKW
jgi:hypothetical protein